MWRRSSKQGDDEYLIATLDQPDALRFTKYTLGLELRLRNALCVSAMSAAKVSGPFFGHWAEKNVRLAGQGRGGI